MMKSKPIIIEKASAEDSPRIAEIEKICFSVPWSEIGVKDFIENPLCIMFAAKDGDIICGYIGLYIIADECDIANVAVVPEFRNRGIAKNLIAYATEYAREKSVGKMMLEVRASNTPAISLYKKFGFEEVGIRKNYYTQPKEDALLMDKILTEKA
ncbi:MAG: ribosomal-protein-alanine N-acetyltransferase [Ruminococcaceae bacterium]|nr:ribosomal-protein-alanine N-acetyltransferase [Oscillospiraceae bacterium]